MSLRQPLMSDTKDKNPQLLDKLIRTHGAFNYYEKPANRPLINLGNKPKENKANPQELKYAPVVQPAVKPPAIKVREPGQKQLKQQKIRQAMRQREQETELLSSFDPGPYEAMNDVPRDDEPNSPSISPEPEDESGCSCFGLRFFKKKPPRLDSFREHQQPPSHKDFERSSDTSFGCF